MNYVAFEGVSQLDNLYVQATGKMRAARILLDREGEDKEKIDKAIRFEKQSRLDR